MNVEVRLCFGTLLCRVCRKGRRRVSTSKLRVMEREDESDEEEEEEELLNRLLIAALMFEETLFGGPEKRKRSGNRKRNREHVQRTIDGWTDLMFRRQFRMTRSSFGKLRDIIDRQFPPDLKVLFRKVLSRILLYSALSRTSSSCIAASA